MNTAKQIAYRDGQEAYHKQEPLDWNPYKRYGLRSAWSYGWQDELAKYQGNGPIGPPRK